MNSIEQSILSTVVFYDTFNLPLTSWEIFEYLSLPSILRNTPEFRYGFREIINALDGNNLRELLDQKNGFYFLKGRGFLRERRIEYQKISDWKWKKFLRIIKWFGVAPFVKMIFANGSLAMNNTDEKSDLDVFIVARAGRIWTVRFLLAALTALMGVKRFNESKNVNNKICFNHFVADKSIHMPFHSIYTANIFARLELVFRADKNISEEKNARNPREFYGQNQWMKEYLPNFNGVVKNSQRFTKNYLLFAGKAGEWLLGGRMGNILEVMLRKYQSLRIQRGVKNKNKDMICGRIVADDEQLEFHPHSPERKIIDGYNNKMFQLGFTELANENDSGFGTFGDRMNAAI